MLVYLVLFSHWFADFVCQTDYQAQNKSKSMIALSSHIASYTLATIAVLIAGTVALDMDVGMVDILMYSVINGLVHMFIDFFTSRVSSRLWARGKVHYFFVTIGFDQFLHVAILVYTMSLLR